MHQHAYTADPEMEYQQMRAILNEVDFAGLCPGQNAPLDEYEFESALLCASLNTAHGVSEAFDTVVRVFGYSFNISPEDPQLKSWAVTVAERIATTVPPKPEMGSFGPAAVDRNLAETGVLDAVEQISSLAAAQGLEGTLLPHAVAKVMSAMEDPRADR